jgi:hypothetical protein
MKNEMYVEELTPVCGSTKPFPLASSMDLVRREL